jgi:hypothetical protein
MPGRVATARGHNGKRAFTEFVVQDLIAARLCRKACRSADLPTSSETPQIIDELGGRPASLAIADARCRARFLHHQMRSFAHGLPKKGEEG